MLSDPIGTVARADTDGKGRAGSRNSRSRFPTRRAVPRCIFAYDELLCDLAWEGTNGGEQDEVTHVDEGRRSHPKDARAR